MVGLVCKRKLGKVMSGCLGEFVGLKVKSSYRLVIEGFLVLCDFIWLDKFYYVLFKKDIFDF